MKLIDLSISLSVALLSCGPSLAQQPATHPAASLSSPGAPAAPANTINPTAPPGDSPAAAEASHGMASGDPGGFARTTSSSAASDETPPAPPSPELARLLVMGTPVKDRQGALVGKVSGVVKDGRGRTLGVMVRAGRRDVTLEVSSLSAQGRFLISQDTRGRLLAG